MNTVDSMNMKKMWVDRLTCVVQITVSSIVPLLVVGCEKLDTGAFAEPTVRIKLAESSPAAETGSGNSGTGATATAGGVGNLIGRVTFEGTRPVRPPLYKMGTADKDPSVCSATGDIPNEDLVVSESNGVANVFVFLDKAPAGYSGSPPTEAIPFDQKNCTFLTHALFCQVGQPVMILNSDGVLHNTRLNAPRNGQKNNSVGANDKVGIKLVYTKPERAPVSVKCDLHSWMSAYHLVLDHPFAAVTDKEGNFQIENLPAGTHQFKVWHERGEGGKPGFLETKWKVTIKASEDNRAPDIVTNAAKFGL
jgi:hypothetical protein